MKLDILCLTTVLRHILNKHSTKHNTTLVIPSAIVYTCMYLSAKIPNSSMRISKSVLLGNIRSKDKTPEGGWSRIDSVL